MKVFLTTVHLLLLTCCVSAQRYTSASIFAHNDYVRSNPFHTAYDLRVGYIEADVFLVDDALLVAHTRLEIKGDKTLEALYLKPLQQKLMQNKGSAYPGSNQRLTLMIDLKTEGTATLTKLVEILMEFPEITRAKTLHIMISGSVPEPARWKDYPDFIHFDGRPTIDYTEDQLKRISMISTSFRDVSKWNGKEPLLAGDREKIQSLITAVHEKDKPVRFWATPDFPQAWEVLMELKPDVIVTDDVEALSSFINKRSNSKN
jgi:alkaline phosphatase